MIIPVVQDGLKSFYGRIAGDHFVSTLAAIPGENELN